MPDDIRFFPERIAAIDLPYAGAVVPLSALTTITRPVGPSVLARENLAPVTIATAAIEAGRRSRGATAAVRAKLADLPAPPGYRIEIGGQLANARQTQRDLGQVFGLGARSCSPCCSCNCDRSGCRSSSCSARRSRSSARCVTLVVVRHPTQRLVTHGLRAARRARRQERDLAARARLRLERDGHRHSTRRWRCRASADCGRS